MVGSREACPFVSRRLGDALRVRLLTVKRAAGEQFPVVQRNRPESDAAVVGTDPAIHELVSVQNLDDLEIAAGGIVHFLVVFEALIVMTRSAPARAPVVVLVVGRLCASVFLDMH